MIYLRLEFTVFQLEAPCSFGHFSFYMGYRLLGVSLRYTSEDSLLFHHQISTCTENVKFREETVVFRPGSSSGQKNILFTARISKCSYPTFYLTNFRKFFKKSLSKERACFDCWHQKRYNTSYNRKSYFQSVLGRNKNLRK